MRTCVVFLMSAFFCQAPAAAADWRLVSQHGFSKIYMDPASRKELAEGAVSVRALTDYDPLSEQATRFRLSEKGLSEIETVLLDCANEKYRSEGGNWFEGPMATGTVRSAYPAKPAWSRTPPFYAGLFSTLCARR